MANEEKTKQMVTQEKVVDEWAEAPVPAGLLGQAAKDPAEQEDYAKGMRLERSATRALGRVVAHWSASGGGSWRLSKAVEALKALCG